MHIAVQLVDTTSEHWMPATKEQS